MTYSRPGTRTVNALQNVPTPMDVGVKGRSSVEVSSNGRLLDNRNPNQLIKNAEASTQAITGFLNELVDTGAKVYKGALMEQAYQQIGELYASGAVDDLYSDNPDFRNVTRALSPLARDMFAENQARAGLITYRENLATFSLGDSRLTNPDPNDREAQARAWVEQRDRALQTSGLKGLPPQMLAIVGGDMAQAEAGVRAQLQKAEYGSNAEAQDVVAENGLGATLVNWRNSVDVILASDKSDDEKKEAYGNALLRASNSIKDQIERGRKNGVYSAQESLVRLVNGTERQIALLIRDDKPQEAMQLLLSLKELSKVPILVNVGDGQLNFWEQKIPGSKEGTSTTFAGWLNTQEITLEKLEDKWEKDENMKAVRPLIINAMSPDLNVRAQAREQLIQMLPQLKGNADALVEIARLFSGAEDFGRTETETQELAALPLLQELGNPNRNRGAFYDRVTAMANSGQISPGRALSLVARNQQEPDQGQRQAYDAVRVTDEYGYTRNAASTYVEALNEAKWPLPSSFKDAGEWVTYESNLIKSEAAEATRKEINAGLADGKSYTQQEAEALYKNNVDKVLRQRLEGLKQADEKAVTQDFNGIVLNEVDYTQNAMNAGKSGTALFAPSLVEEAKRQNLPTTGSAGYKALGRLLIKRMGKAVDPDGKPAFTNPQKTWQEMRRNAQQQGATPPAAPVQSPVTSRDSLFDPQTRDAVRRGQEQQRQDAKGNQSNAGNAGGQPTIFDTVKTGLINIAGALLPGGSSPAAAATLDHEEGLDRLAAVWNKPKPTVNMSTPPLPQVAAGVQTQSVPLAITSDRHPYFVTIGIAEGTRTPNGGYTRAYYGHGDPGDGNNNRGTVSGGGRREPLGNAAQVDRVWMGRLTQRAISTAPILQRLGLKPGTQGWNRVMFNVLDASVQGPATVNDFLKKLPQVKAAGWSVEAIAKARADSYINPATGRLQAGGFRNNYSLLLRDQRSRAGVWDYRKRL